MGLELADGERTLIGAGQQGGDGGILPDLVIRPGRRCRQGDSITIKARTRTIAATSPGNPAIASRPRRILGGSPGRGNGPCDILPAAAG
jgi:hypothetical protein